ncbi:MAG TPA: M1 family metallopeptidase [Thermomicrobiales bacterium]|jgi:hypothetical protein|nr:M1 family metallopeptidase [Thermomicrobiales bacterium]
MALLVALLCGLFPALSLSASVDAVAARGVDTIAVEDGQGDRDEALWAGISADVRDEIYDATAGSLSRYRIAVEITPPTSEDELTSIEGTVDLLFVNPLEDPLDEVVFRLYSNDVRYGAGTMEVDDVEVDGEAAGVDLSEEDTVATVALPDELEPGDAVTITYAFAGVVDNEPAGSYGMYTFSPDSGTLALAHWYPMLAGLTPDGGWNTEPVSVNSDPVYTTSALYDVSLSMPGSWQVAASGVEVASDEDGDLTTRQYVTGPSRDFTIVADETFEQIEQEIGGTVVVSWFEPEDEDGGQEVLDAGVATLEHFEPLLGDYPYGEMDLVQVSVGNGAAGIEFPQLMFIGGAYYDDPPTEGNRVSFLESLVVHEVLHQWFYGIVGNNHYDHAWQDESLANFLMAYFYELEYGPETYEAAYLGDIEIPFMRYLFGVNDVVVDTPSDDFETANDYVIAAYYKGAIGMRVILDEIGEEAFFEGLSAYVGNHRFAVATPDDLFAAWEDASGEDLSPIRDHWFESADAADDYTEADLEAAEQRLQELRQA